MCLRLHMLCELEHAFTELQKDSKEAEVSKQSEPKLNWDDRLVMTQNSFRAKEPVLALRRALLSLSKGYELANSIKYSVLTLIQYCNIMLRSIRLQWIFVL